MSKGSSRRKLIVEWKPELKLWTRVPEQEGFFELLEPFSETWPPSGSMRSGRAWQLRRSALPIPGSGSSSTRGRLMPTPRTSDTNGAGAHGDGGMDLRTAVSLLPTPNASDYKGSGATQGRVRNGKPRPLSDADLPEAVKLLPTPMVGDAKGTRNATAGRKTDNPNVNVGWTLSDVIFDGQLSNPSAPPADAASGCTTPEGSAPDLAAAPALTPNSDGPMKLMPTPTSSDGDRTSSTYGRGNPTLTGAITEPPSDGGKPSSDVPPPGPLTLWDV